MTAVGDRVLLRHAPYGYGPEGRVERIGPCNYHGCRNGDACIEIRVISLKSKVTTTINRSAEEFTPIEEP